MGVRYVVYWHLLSPEAGSQPLKVNLIVYDNDVGGGRRDDEAVVGDCIEILAGDAGHGDKLLPLGAGVLPDHGQSCGQSDERGGAEVYRERRRPR